MSLLENCQSLPQKVAAGAAMDASLSSRISTAESCLDATVVDLTALLTLATALQTALTGAGVTDIASLKAAVAAVTLPTITTVAP